MGRGFLAVQWATVFFGFMSPWEFKGSFHRLRRSAENGYFEVKVGLIKNPSIGISQRGIWSKLTIGEIVQNPDFCEFCSLMKR